MDNTILRAGVRNKKPQMTELKFFVMDGFYFLIFFFIGCICFQIEIDINIEINFPFV